MQTTVNESVAAELRVASARTQTTAAGIAEQIDQNAMWVSRRLRGVVDLTVEDVVSICRAMNVDPVDLLRAAIPSPATTP